MKPVQAVRSGLRMLLPLPWRQAFAQRCRLAKDRKLGQVFASRALSECAASLKVAPRVVLQPGQTFSFWHSIGQASRANGFVEGRNIIQGRLRKELGGGLCQLSSSCITWLCWGAWK